MTVLASVLLVTPVGYAADVSDFFAPAPDRGAELPPDKVFPQGRLFPFGGFSGVAVREAASGFTLHGPAYGSANNLVIPHAEASGMYAVYSVGIPMNFLERDGQPALKLTEQEIADEIRRQVLEVVDRDAVAWWYLTPEELRPWRAAEMEYLEVAARTIRETDPKGRPVWMYDPNHRTSTSLAMTGAFLDIVGKGMYTNYAGQKGHRIWNRWSVEQQIEAIKMSGRPGAIQIALPEMFQEPDPTELSRVPQWARHDVYVALASGAQGVVIFSLARRAGFSDAAWQAYYDAYARVARELNGELALGQVFLFGERRDDLELTITAGEEVVSPKVGAGGITEEIPYPAVTMANIAYGDERYLFVVNSSENPVEVRIDGFPDRSVYVRDTFTGRPLPDIQDALSLQLPGLGVVGLRLSRGYVWLTSPEPEAVVDRASVPVQVVAPGLTVERVQIALDGKPIYDGTALPADLSLRTAELEAGEHELVVSVTDSTGRWERKSFPFSVEHLRLPSPNLEWGARLRGRVSLEIEAVIAPEEIRHVEVRLRSAMVGDEGRVLGVYSGTGVPEGLVIETTEVGDGAYDLEIEVTTDAGIVSGIQQRILIDNWVVLEDAILAPSTSGWFGIQERLRTVRRSEGWEYVEDGPKTLFGDADRIRPVWGQREYLVWRLSNLGEFVFTLYLSAPDVTDASLAGRLEVAVSRDEQEWHVVPHTVLIDASVDGTEVNEGWRRVEVSGRVPEGVEGEFLRLTLVGSDTGEDLQLGHAVLRGIKQ